MCVGGRGYQGFTWVSRVKAGNSEFWGLWLRYRLMNKIQTFHSIYTKPPYHDCTSSSSEYKVRIKRNLTLAVKMDKSMVSVASCNCRDKSCSYVQDFIHLRMLVCCVYLAIASRVDFGIHRPTLYWHHRGWIWSTNRILHQPVG